MDAGQAMRLLGIRVGVGSNVQIPAKMITEALQRSKVDAVEVVRCKECFWCIGKIAACKLRCTNPLNPHYIQAPDGYCNYGCPKVGAKNG